MTINPHLKSAKQWRSKNKVDKAIAAIQEGLQQSPTDIELLIEACELSQAAKDQEACLMHAKTLIQHHQCSWTGYRFAAESHRQQAHQIEAELVIEEALKNFPQ